MLRKEKQELQDNLEQLTKKVEREELSQSLVSMLKESHESLQKSNEALLQEIQDLKDNYFQQQKQWQLELNQLKDNLDFLNQETVTD